MAGYLKDNGGLRPPAFYIMNNTFSYINFGFIVLILLFGYMYWKGDTTSHSVTVKYFGQNEKVSMKLISFVKQDNGFYVPLYIPGSEYKEAVNAIKEEDRRAKEKENSELAPFKKAMDSYNDL